VTAKLKAVILGWLVATAAFCVCGTVLGGVWFLDNIVNGAWDDHAPQHDSSRLLVSGLAVAVTLSAYAGRRVGLDWYHRGRDSGG
jgi:hypothetical protein